MSIQEATDHLVHGAVGAAQSWIPASGMLRWCSWCPLSGAFSACPAKGWVIDYQLVRWVTAGRISSCLYHFWCAKPCQSPWCAVCNIQAVWPNPCCCRSGFEDCAVLKFLLSPPRNAKVLWAGVYFKRCNPGCPWRVRAGACGETAKESSVIWNYERSISVCWGGRSVWEMELCLSQQQRLWSQSSPWLSCLCYRHEEEPVAFLVLLLTNILY